MIKKRCLIILLIFSFLFSGLGGFFGNNEVYAGESTADVIVVLDPGHDSRHGGAAHYGYKEHELVFKIASYCKKELEKYNGVTVYMTRTTNDCAFGSSTSGSDCLKKRVEYAKSVGADVFVSFHLNALENASKCGACVYYPNSNYRAEFGTEGKKLATNILGELNNLGISTSGEGIYTRNSQDYKYPDGSVADYLSVIRNAKEQGFPAVLIEHAYLSNYNDVITYLNSEEKLQKLGIADATAIANYLGLTNNSVVKQGSDGNWYYYVDGIVDTSYTGLVSCNQEWWYFKEGKADFSYTDLVSYRDEIWYVKEGKVDFSYNGIATNKQGSWFIQNGKLDNSINGLANCGNGRYYFKAGRVDDSLTTVILDTDGWRYIKNGKIDFNANIVARNENGWWYVRNGKVDFSYNGLGTNENGTWYIRNGRVDFNVNGIVYIDGWYYFKNGRVASETTTVARNENGWWYIKNGKVDFNHNGLGTNENGTWYIQNGKVNFNVNGVVYCDGWHYFRNGSVAYGVTTIAYNENGWWYVRNGKVDFNATTVAYNENGWWYVKNGKVDFNYNGLGTNENGTWYIQNGKVNFNVNGIVYCDGWHYFKNGRVDYDVTTVAYNKNGWWYVRNGKVDFSYNGLGTNANGTWYIRNGKVDFSVNGLALCGEERWYFKNGAVDYTFNGTVKEGNTSYVVIDGQAYEEGTAIMGESSVTVNQMVAYYNARTTYPTFYSNSDAPDIETFCQIYLEECESEGVKAEVAFCQAMLETGFLKYGGQVDISQYNFAGIGALSGGTAGASFPDVRTGIRAQVQHLKAYACQEPLNNTCVDPRFPLVKRGCAPYVEWLGIQENPEGKGWASSENYGFIIRNNYIEKLLNTK